MNDAQISISAIERLSKERFLSRYLELVDATYYFMDSESEYPLTIETVYIAIKVKKKINWSKQGF